jgi:hypothetical protein
MDQNNRTSLPKHQSSESATRACPDCESGFEFLTLREFFSRREFIKTAASGVVAAGALAVPTVVVRAAEAAEASAGATAAKAAPESLVKKLYESLSSDQKKAVAFDWDFTDQRGLLRTRVSNNWNITRQMISTDFYTKDQQEMIRGIYEGLFHPDWVAKIDKQLQDDGGGYGKSQSIAIFGQPGDGKFELVMTGRHMTVRVDGNSIDHMAFGGPIFHGHDPSRTFNEQPGHPDNVFWPQAVAANKIFEMLDGKQRKLALQSRLPAESAVGFRGADGQFPGIPISQLSHDQRDQLESTMNVMLSPYRNSDREEVRACLQKQGGLNQCSLAFYQAGDVGDDGLWDNWRLEGPSFVWYFRGSPHVHLWINIGDDASVQTNAQG